MRLTWEWPGRETMMKGNSQLESLKSVKKRLLSVVNHGLLVQLLRVQDSLSVPSWQWYPQLSPSSSFLKLSKFRLTCFSYTTHNSLEATFLYPCSEKLALLYPFLWTSPYSSISCDGVSMKLVGTWKGKSLNQNGRRKKELLCHTYTHLPKERDGKSSQTSWAHFLQLRTFFIICITLVTSSLIPLPCICLSHPSSLCLGMIYISFTQQ